MLNNVKFLKGTAQSFGAIEVKDANTFYYIDDKDLYLGSIKLSNGEDLAAAILRVAANETAIGNISKDYLKASDKTELSNAIAAEKSRAEGIEGGLNTRLAAVEGDYLKGADKSELEEAIEKINEELGALTGSEEGKSITQMIESAVSTLRNDLQPQITKNKDDIAAEILRATGVESGLDTRVKAVEEDIDYFFKDALKDEEGVQAYKDTLKEIQDYINSDAEAAGAMSASIKANTDAIDAIEADYLKSSDKTTLQGNIDGVAGRVTTLEGQIATKVEQESFNTVSGKVTTLEGKVDVEKVSTAISTAKSEAITSANSYSDGLAKNYATAAQGALADSAVQTVVEGTENGTILVDGESIAVHGLGSAAYAETTSFDAAGSASTAETNAKSYAKTYADGLAGNYDASGSAAQALIDAKAYADGLAGNYEVAGAAATAAATAKTEAVSAAATDATTKANAAEANAKAYVDNALAWGTIGE